MNLFRYILKLSGFPIDSATQRLREVERLDAASFDTYRKTLLWEIWEHHVTNNFAYRTWIAPKISLPISRWDQIPILTKSDLQVPIEERLTSGFTKKSVRIHNTSGSSGHPFYFGKDMFCHAMTWAVIFDRFSWYGLEYGKSLQARFYGIPLAAFKNQKETIKDRVAARIRFPVFDLSDKVLEKYLSIFYKKKFDYLNGYTSSLVLLARFLIKKGLVLKEVCPTLKVAIPTSEMCSDADKKILETGFGVPVVREYGAAELDIIAFEDKDGDWIVTDENIWVEVVDDDNNVLPPGRVGKLIITSLYNKAMPFIRYELGDIGAISEVKKGKYQVLKSLQGRTNDIALLPSGKKSPGLTFYYITKSLLEGGGFMKEFIIKQTATDHFHYEYVADREITEAEKKQVNEAMDMYLEQGLHASFERKEHIDRTKAGKLKQFQNLVDK